MTASDVEEVKELEEKRCLKQAVAGQAPESRALNDPLPGDLHLPSPGASQCSAPPRARGSVSRAGSLPLVRAFLRSAVGRSGTAMGVFGSGWGRWRR